MKKNTQKVLMVMVAAGLTLLAACGNSSAGSHAASDNQSATNNASETNDDTLDKTNGDENTPENVSKTAENTPTGTEEDTEDSVTVPNDGKSPKSRNSEGKVTENIKEEYLKKLNETKKEIDAMEATDTSTYALKDLAGNRWELWDDLLNEVYGVLEEQLSTEEMDQLREEQRNWLTYRDDTALEASLKYKGGTQEHLEYVTVLGNLTEERCYELVEEYIK